jgi:hypothetical protein
MSPKVIDPLEPLTPKEKARRRQANKRAKDAGKEIPFPVVSSAQQIADEELRAELIALDASEAFYHKSECRSRIECYELYCAWARDKKILEKHRTFKQWLRLRDLFRKNLYLLCKLVLKLDVIARVHRPMMKMFVKKNFDSIYHRDYTWADIRIAFNLLRTTRTRKALILDPRGFFKSTINQADMIQWLLACPEVRIFLETGEVGLAKKFAKGIKKRFCLAEGAKPSDLQLLYPEYILQGVDGDSAQPLECPARKINVDDPSIYFSSIVSQNTGRHSDVLKCDDVVTNMNSNTPDAREKIRDLIDDLDNNLMPYGFMDAVGTRYVGGKDPDYYGTMLLRDAEAPIEEKDLTYFVRSCWTVKPEYSETPLRELTGDMVVCTFPEESNFRILKKKLDANERLFRNQQLNEPVDSAADSPFVNEFTMENIRPTCHPKEAEPKVGLVRLIQIWDFSYGDRRTNDNSCGVTGLIYQRLDGQYALWVIDVCMDKWAAPELVTNMINFYEKHKPEKIFIEQALGHGFLHQLLIHHAGRRGSTIANYDILNWIPITNENAAKRNRIKNLNLLHADGRLNFTNGLWMDEGFKQLCSYTGEKSTAYRKDDFCDALGLFIKFIPGAVFGTRVNPEELEREMEKANRQARLKAHQERLFGGFAPTISTAEPTIQKPEPQRDPRRAMLDKILPPGMRT